MTVEDFIIVLQTYDDDAQVVDEDGRPLKIGIHDCFMYPDKKRCAVAEIED